MKRFHDRRDAGKQLADSLRDYRDRSDVVLLALPRGGVPVASAMAEELGHPLDVWLVRKLGLPGHEELAMGAISTGGIQYLNQEIIQQFGIYESVLEQVIAKEMQELERRNHLYRMDRAMPVLEGRTALVVDDGLATGSTMRAAVMSLKQTKAAWVEVAVPVASRTACDELRQVADTVHCLQTPDPFYGVGQWYEDFSQTSDAEVQELLSRINNNHQAA